MATAPKSVNIRTYQVGFGDCFLLSFRYDSTTEKHVLIDFGSTALPPDAPKSRMMDIALDIKKRSGGKLHAVIATHRHRDHVSGFETRAGGKGTGDIIRALKPNLVVQPWTEDPKLSPTATGSKTGATTERSRRHIAGLSAMHSVALHTIAQSKRARYFPKALKEQLSFLGEDNILNPSAVKNLMSMAKNAYVHTGSPSGLERRLPGIEVHVLGPPTVEQTDTIKKQRSTDPDEFWHFQANAMRFVEPARDAKGKGRAALFPKHVRSSGPTFPIDTRWLIYHIRTMQGDQLLQIVRMLDNAMNNTSVVLLFEVGKKVLLFPGDAQIENWQYALGKPEFTSRLSSVNLYKVGHHGSLNATPKTLWGLFKNRSKDKSNMKRLVSLLSTREHMHGSEDKNTEVPRRTLVSALMRESKLLSTNSFEGGKYYEDTVVEF